MPCFTPGEVVDPWTAARIGRIAERFVSDEYLVSVGRTTFFPASVKDFSDIHSGFANTTLFVAWMAANNPHLTPQQILFVRATSGLFRVPDIAVHDGARQEIYEVKPGSVSGKLAGAAKLGALAALFKRLTLNYIPGTIFAPNVSFILADGLVLGCRVRIKLHIWLESSGLILYELCVDGELDALAAKISVAVMLATFVVMLLYAPGGILAPAL